ncbi:MAG: hypothetical protein CWE10_06545 [Symbiobacterium thermophilum]|uniref:DUF2953 domain-containing protein n=2 Tax=Symbiobacterium thermophilum TaxID=2734 RepID=A0A953LDW5_SYMTR|nr:hypothetical protein [Symbiobacterium thermophilum]
MLMVLALLFVPFDLRLCGRADLAADDWESPLAGRAEWRLRLRWGLLPVTAGAQWSDGRLGQPEVRVLGFPVRGGKKGGRGHRPKTPGATKRKAGRKAGRTKPDPELLLTLAREAVQLPGRLWRSLGVRLTAEGSYGLPDPALTGLCEAIRWSAGLGRSLRLTPDFKRPCLVGRGELTGRVYGFRLAAIAWHVARRPAVWNRLVGTIRFRPLRTILLRGGA